ncbi:hypothetical protein K466DRAFT_604989 [Polyporus arcularius HHB13444]|uniref:Uncharacterized protein n=1 Tax=Polyporus arcularius HHB13444 TaxID=1314778 RepID=A0A5C3NVR0_9APHY|nr:hypothetical protein K466DRAFT_604989 [Polyporus arcularius HHB13444]
MDLQSSSQNSHCPPLGRSPKRSWLVAGFSYVEHVGREVREAALLTDRSRRRRVELKPPAALADGSGVANARRIKRVRWLTEIAERRLVDRLLDFRNSKRCIFTISQVPKEACWGPRTATADLSGVLCWWGQPVRVWAIGYLRRLAIVVQVDAPLPQVIVGVEFVRDVDAESMGRLSGRHAGEAGAGGMFESKRISNGGGSIRMFREVYDATKEYTSKCRMPRISLSDLVIGDVVLVETKMMRIAGSAGWASWYELQSISRLLPRPCGVDDAVIDDFPFSL